MSADTTPIDTRAQLAERERHVSGDELEELRHAIRDFLTAKSPSSAVRTLMMADAGYDPGVWLQMARELGLHGIAVPEEWGGAGAGMPELVVVFEEMGAALLCAPFFATVALAASAVLASGDRAAMADLLPRFVDGTSMGTVALNGTLEAWTPDSVGASARSTPDGFRLSGDLPLVLDGHAADVILVAANTDRGVSLFAVAGTADGLRREQLVTLDRTRKAARLRLDDVPARLIGDDGAAAPVLARVSDLATVALAAEQLGVAQRSLDMAVRYAKDRIQFGRAIGSFQAVKHRCADMLVLVEGARSAVVHAAQVADTDELALAASVAKMTCSEVALQTALDSMRIHGGIGFTWEHDAHLYVRRAKSTELILGSPGYHARRLADLVTI